MNAPLNESLEHVILEALDLLEGGAGVEEILARYPAEAAELRPYLLTAARLATLATQPSLTAERTTRRGFLAAAEAMRREGRPRRAALWPRLLAPVLAVLAVVVLGGAALVGASGRAMPGSALYEVKRWGENVRLALANDPERAADLRERFRLERVAEIDRLLAAGAVADVSLTGGIEAMDDDEWIVAGLPVVVGAWTTLDGTPAVGAWVQVDGQTVAGAVRAIGVTVLNAPPSVTPTPAPTPPAAEPSAPAGQMMPGDDEATPSPTATRMATPTRAATATPTPTALPTTAAIATPTATIAPPALPSATPGDDNNNDNSGDNANDNGGDDNGGDDNANDNGGDDNNNDNGDDNNNDNGGDDNSNDNGGDNNNDNGGDDNANDNGDDHSGSGGGDNDNGPSDSGDSGDAITNG